jgi:hypothetical protein
MIIYHCTNKKNAESIIRSGKFNAQLHKEQMTILAISVDKANWTGLYYWFKENATDYFILGEINIY